MTPGFAVAIAVCVLAFRGVGPPPPVIVERHAPSAIRTTIVGASDEQRRVLLQILARVDPRHVEKIVLTAVSEADSWRPDSDGGISIALSGPDTYEASWERILVGGAFMDRSNDEGLPPVWYWGEDGFAGTLAGGGSEHAKPRSERPSRRGELAAGIAAAARVAGARVEEIRLLKPLGGALAVTLRVDDPAPFLANRLDRYLEGEPPTRNRYSDGVLLQVLGPGRGVIYASASTERLATFGTWIPWRLEGCRDTAMPRPAGYSPPPCPLEG